MIALIQRVTEGSISIDGQMRARIGRWISAFVAVEPSDTEQVAARMLERLLGYRIFPDGQGRMNLSLRDIGVALLLVPQFTLTADTSKGMRPSFSSGASPETAQRLFGQLVREAQHVWPFVATGVFGAEMAVSLVNDGPVTFWLEA